MCCNKVIARFWEQTLLTGTDTIFFLFITGCTPKISCRTTYIMNISFELRIFYHLLCFFNDRLMTAHLNHSSLMKGQRTKAATAKASAIACQAKFNFIKCRNTTIFFIDRMVSPHIWQCIHIIHL